MASSKLDTGSVVCDKYVLGKVLGGGSFGTVFRAVDEANSTEVAVKVSRGTGLAKERNLCEARLLEMFKTSKPAVSEFVAKMETWFETCDCVVIVLELLPYDLRKIMSKRASCDLYTVYFYGRQMLEFLHRASLVHLVHGDIKPENILIERASHRLKFIDFGLSHAPGYGSRYTSTQTTFYRAPEVALGYSCDERADMWSVGCILLEFLLGFPVFRARDNDELLQIVVKIVGMPEDSFLASAPEGDKYFEFSQKHNRWVARKTGVPEEPMGVKNFIEAFFQGDFKGPVAPLVRIIEGMLRFNPAIRYVPAACLNHTFFKAADPVKYSESKFKYKY